MKTPRLTSIALVIAGLAVPALAARLANTAAGAGYYAFTHDDPPKNPANPQVAWKDAIVWTLASGALAGLAQLVARRLLAKTSVPAEGLDMKRRLRQIVG